jgi:hypothetical protein
VASRPEIHQQHQQAQPNQQHRPAVAPQAKPADPDDQLEEDGPDQKNGRNCSRLF